MEVIIDGVKYAPQPEVPKDKTLLSALEVRFDSDAGDNMTVREYLHELLTKVWDEGEGFDGKRPWGNSGWDNDVVCALVVSGHIPGQVEHRYGDVEVEPDDWDEAYGYVRSLIAAIFFGVKD